MTPVGSESGSRPYSAARQAYRQGQYGISTSHRDVFIKDVPVEIDIIIPRIAAVPAHGICYEADDVPDDILHDEGYRRRCRYKVERLRELFQSDGQTHTQGVNHMTEPTYEELKAKIARTGSQAARRRYL